MRHGSLFSGIGGFDLASEWMGWENVFHCEWNEFGQRVLKHYWPKAISYNDITKTDFTIHRRTIDILTGGFPCQPYSAAGKRLGKEDDRHLWPEMLRAIREIQPTWVVGENVRGLTNWNGGVVFDEVQADMEDEGYEVTPFLLPACAVNAPHRRDRIWFVAYSMHDRNRQQEKSGGKYGDGADFEKQESRKQHSEQLNQYGNYGDASNSISIRWDGKSEKTRPNNAFGEGRMEQKIRQHRNEIWGEIERCSTNNSGCNIPTWETFPTQSPICYGNDGIPDRLDGITFPKWRNESIKAGGNAIVPQVAFEIFKAIKLGL